MQAMTQRSKQMTHKSYIATPGFASDMLKAADFGIAKSYLRYSFLICRADYRCPSGFLHSAWQLYAVVRGVPDL